MDFKELEILRGKKPFRKKLMSQDKGQKEMVRSFIRQATGNGNSPIPIAEIFSTTASTFAVVDSLARNQATPVRPSVVLRQGLDR